MERVVNIKFVCKFVLLFDLLKQYRNAYLQIFEKKINVNFDFKGKFKSALELKPSGSSGIIFEVSVSICSRSPPSRLEPNGVS